MGFSIVFLLPDFQTDLFYFIFHKFYCLCGVNHGAEHFLFLSDNGFPKISLVDICMRVIAISILEQNRFCACLHQILVRKKSNSLRIHQHNFIFRTGNRNRIGSRHIVEFAFHASASAACERFAWNSHPVCIQMCLFDFAHCNAETFQFCRDS